MSSSQTTADPKVARSHGVQAIIQSMTGRILIISLNAATGVVTARALHPTGRGEQAAIMLWPILLSNATTLGLPSALTYYTRKYRDSTPALTGVAITLGIIASAVCITIAALLMPFLLPNYSAFTVFAARCLLFNIPVGIGMLIVRAVLESKGEFGVSVLSQLLLPAFTLVPLLWLWLSRSMTPFNAGMAYSFNGVPVMIWLFWRLRKTTKVTFAKPIETAKLLLSYGLRSYGIDLCGTLSAYVDQALVITILKPIEMGFYVVALSISRMLNFCQASVVMVLLPKTAGLLPSEVVQLTGRAARFSLLATALCALGTAILSPIAIRLLYGSGFEEAVPVLRVLLLEVVIAGTVMVLAQAPMALGRPGVTTILQISGLILTIPLMLILVPRYGIVGAASALLITTIARLAFITAAFPFVLRVPSPSLWCTFADLRDVSRIAKGFASRWFTVQPVSGQP